MYPSMYDLYNRKAGVTPCRIGNCEIFVNFNRYNKPFIRVNVYPEKSKTFPFTRRGYKQAIEFLKGGDETERSGSADPQI